MTTMPSDDQPSFSSFFDAWELFGTPALAGAIAGALLGALGVYIVLRRMVFLSAALSQAAGLGVSLSLLVAARLPSVAAFVTPSLGASVATLLSAVPFFSPAGPRGARRDGWLGTLYLVGAAGTLALGSKLVDVEDIQSLLFGSAVVVLPESFHGLVALAVVVGAVHVWWMRGFMQASLDPEGARVRGLPVQRLDLVLLVTLALSISSSTRILGALPVFAFSVLPAMAALRLTATVPRAIALATVLGAASGFAGYLVAYRCGLPVGASQALFAAVLVVISAGLGRARSALAR